MGDISLDGWSTIFGVKSIQGGKVNQTKPGYPHSEDSEKWPSLELRFIFDPVKLVYQEHWGDILLRPISRQSSAIDFTSHR
ncbi:hypothetical protein O181_097720, partial [Austropuccinia psidii MF-1]|nr:hypothetical protein [Austropuccinia psidii MF-1]